MSDSDPVERTQSGMELAQAQAQAHDTPSMEARVATLETLVSELESGFAALTNLVADRPQAPLPDPPVVRTERRNCPHCHKLAYTLPGRACGVCGKMP